MSQNEKHYGKCLWEYSSGETKCIKVDCSCHSLQKESEEKPEDYAKKCPYRIEDCPIDYPKESEWEKEFEKRFPEAVSKYDIAKELYDAGIAELINKPVEVPTARDFVLMQEYNQLIYRFRKFVSQAISQREQEIAEEVKKVRFRFEPPYQCRKGEVMERFWKYQVETLNEVLSIIRH